MRRREVEKALLVCVAVLVLAAGGLRTQASEPPSPKLLADCNNAFGLDLYARLRQAEGNLFLSPYSISTALAMTYAGARGQTAAQMEQVLYFPYKDERLHNVFAGLQAGMKGKTEYELHVANALWGQKGYRFLDSFLSLTRQYYGAGLMQVDFAGDTEGARRTINEWVEEQTNRKIKDLVARGALTPDVRLVLTNAIYFLGTWLQEFDKALTRDEPFRLASGGSVNAPLMHKVASFRYLEGDGFQALEMAYKGNDLAMLVLLPATVDGLPQLEAKLTRQNLDAWVGRMKHERVDVALPRFQMTAQFELSEALQAMGMSEAFVPGRADFSGMDGSRNLFIGLVMHKAFVDVNEKGTEAAAATAVVVQATGLLPERLKVFRADHPFIFIIRHVRTGSILFIGRLAEPKGSGTGAGTTSAPDVAEIERLEAALKAKPEDPEALASAIPLYRHLGQAQNAAKAISRLRKLYEAGKYAPTSFVREEFEVEESFGGSAPVKRTVRALEYFEPTPGATSSRWPVLFEFLVFDEKTEVIRKVFLEVSI